MENHCAFCLGAEMPEPFLLQGTCYCCVQKNLTDSRASSLLGLGTPALGWDRIPSQAQAACFCRKQNVNIQLKLCLPIAGICVCMRMRQLGSLVAAGGQFPMCSTIKGS